MKGTEATKKFDGWCYVCICSCVEKEGVMKGRLGDESTGVLHLFVDEIMDSFIAAMILLFILRFCTTYSLIFVLLCIQ